MIHACPLMDRWVQKVKKETLRIFRRKLTEVRQGSVIEDLNCCVIVETEKIEKTKKQKVNKWFSKEKLKIEICKTEIDRCN